VQLHRSINGVESEIPLKFHKCTEEDYSYFYEPSKKVTGTLQRLKDRGNLKCIDREAAIEIRGQDDTTDHSRLEIIMQPCQKDPNIGKRCRYNY
jgi:hypothetical protein